ncbi:PhzF family phenazine biosynthesis protein [Pseudoalteromonas piratica]|uniref:Phenazine biosynthesis protein PhzF n=1 Tax=Pseudoalteromonas piratica TaxID=1348114 RepID=A0A0A7ELY4_9GAMM|nr:PhzF family phenazine biosynthesis protein [Pseudoalteromonas piratica]AIY67619.1 phenazine biosynthesis protein PhzF [Pseudoalteromonas piratica]
MKLEMHVVDAFTNELFKGNSAAVIITTEWLPKHKMQAIASENNLSETAYLVKDSKGVFHIRWFSPLTEIDFCGHATLASAFVLFSKHPEISKLKFFASAVGEMTIVKNALGRIEMDFPNRQPVLVATSDIPKALLEGLSHPPIEVLKNNQAYFAIYDNEATINAITTDSDKLKQLAPFDVTVSAPSKDFDCASRYFWPANGGDEDPVTGSIHTGIAPYWAEKLNKQQIVALQASKRSGILYCEVSDERVKISGDAVQYLSGTITV